MSRVEKILKDVLCGTSDANIAFIALCQLLKRLGFQERIKGSHHIFTRDNVEEIINIQSKGSKAKPYQVKQVRGIILKHKMEV
jgi:predicted RNA binding protein YcfA (HicA-like mRNA interferase family)